MCLEKLYLVLDYIGWEHIPTIIPYPYIENVA